MFSKYNIPSNAEINLIFIGKKKMKTISKDYKKVNVALPVLTFSYLDRMYPDENNKTFAEIFICYPQAVLLAAEREKRVDNIISQLITHGVENIIKNWRDFIVTGT